MIAKFLGKLEEEILCVLLTGMTLLVFVEVVLRFGFNTGLLWAEELTLYISAWFVLFGASYGIKVGAHIGVDALVKKLPEKSRRLVAATSVILCMVYCGLFLYGGWIYLSKMKMIGIEMEDLPVPKWIAMSVIIIGFVLLVIRLLELLWRIVTGQQDGFHMVDEAQESMHLAQDLKEQQLREQRLKEKRAASSGATNSENHSQSDNEGADK